MMIKHHPVIAALLAFLLRLLAPVSPFEEVLAHADVAIDGEVGILVIHHRFAVHADVC